MSKRFTALLMAIVLMVGVLAVPAMAATGDTVSPQACSHPVKIYTGYYETDWLTINSYTCVHGTAQTGMRFSAAKLTRAFTVSIATPIWD